MTVIKLTKDDYRIAWRNFFETLKDTGMSKGETLTSEFLNFAIYEEDFEEDIAKEAIFLLKGLNGGNLSIDEKDGVEAYRLRLMVLQNPFFMENIEWNTSVRTSFWDHRIRFTLTIPNGILRHHNGCAMYTTLTVNVTREDWIIAFEALVEVFEE